MLKIFFITTVIVTQSSNHKVFQDRALEVNSLKECVTLMNVYITTNKRNEQVVSLTCQVDDGHATIKGD